MTKAMKHILKKLIILSSLFHPSQAHAQPEFTDIDGVVVYSEYYPNPQSRFKGTIVFQNGSGASLKEWTDNAIFLKCIRQQGNALMYDRNGLGKSPPDSSISSDKPITAQLVNSKLIKLLRTKKIQEPYIVVSHSYGGLYAGYFARKHPELVAGMLMVDPVPRNYEYANQILETFKSTRKRLWHISSKEAYQRDNLDSPRDRNMMTADSFYQQLGFDETIKQLEKLPPMSNQFPITIVSSTEMDKNSVIKGDWYTLQKQWLNQNPESMIFKARAGHFIQLDRPKLICKELNKLVKIAITSSKSRE